MNRTCDVYDYDILVITIFKKIMSRIQYLALKLSYMKKYYESIKGFQQPLLIKNRAIVVQYENQSFLIGPGMIKRIFYSFTLPSSIHKLNSEDLKRDNGYQISAFNTKNGDNYRE